MQKPNIVFVLTDQWRAQAFGYAGDPNVKTPKIDALAARSLNFRNTTSVCPVCTPQRASLLTGRFPMSTGMIHNDIYLPREELCMAEILKDAGYATGYIGKWHLDGHGRDSYIPPERRQGFDYWKVLECTHDYNDSYYYAGENPVPRKWDGYDAYAQTRDAQQYMQDHANDNSPFFLFVAYGGPHFPHHSAPDELKALYPPDSLILRPNVPTDMEEHTRNELQGYYGHCTAIDECVGQLYQTLEDFNLSDNTIFIFTSDHGDMHGSHGMKSWTKQVPWEESIRVPFLIRYPAIHNRGRMLETPLNTPDIFPTLLSLAGIPIPSTIEGEDLSDHIIGSAPDRDRNCLFMSPAPFGPTIQAYRGIRNARYTYVQTVEGPWLLYDNQNDPYQMKNLVKDPASAGIRDRMKADLQQHLSRIGDRIMSREEADAKWGYHVEKHCAIPYNGTFTVQSPGPDKGETCHYPCDAITKAKTSQARITGASIRGE